MLKVVGDEAAHDAVDGRSLLDEIAREGARRMLVAALETEVTAPSASSVTPRSSSPSTRTGSGSRWETRRPSTGSTSQVVAKW